MSRCLDEGKDIFKNDCAVDIKRLNEFDSSIQFFAAFIHDKYNKSGALNRFLQMYRIYKNADFGKTQAYLSVENLSCIEGDTANIPLICGCGVKIASLCWNGYNGIAGGADTEEGLSHFGKRVVQGLERHGIVVDVSHMNHKSFYDFVSISSKPFIATHSNCSSVYPHRRNLSDEQIRLIAESGGIIGINLYPVFIGSYKKDYDDIAEHIEHALNIAGEDHIAFGTDFDGADMDERFKSVGDMRNLWSELTKKFGFTLCNKVFYQNCCEFCKKL